MQSSLYNLFVEIPETGETLVLNTFTGAQAFVTADILAVLHALDECSGGESLPADWRATAKLLEELKFVVADRQAEREAFEDALRTTAGDGRLMQVIAAVTLECNFACEYCFQGDHSDHNRSKNRMSFETADRLISWAVQQMEANRPTAFELLLFGGEPLLNWPVVKHLAEALWSATGRLGIEMAGSLVTNGWLLNKEIAETLAENGITQVKVTLDGLQHSHDGRRHLIGGQGTFDKILRNLEDVADVVNISIGANFDEASYEGFKGLAQFIRQQPLARSVSHITFSPIVRKGAVMGSAASGCRGSRTSEAQGQAVTFYRTRKASSDTAAGFDVDGALTTLSGSSTKEGFQTKEFDLWFKTVCDVHADHVHTVGPDGSLYKCAGFSGDQSMAVGNIVSGSDARHRAAAESFAGANARKYCGDCALIPVCVGGCTFAAYSEQGTLDAPVCHKMVFVDTAVVAAHKMAGLPAPPIEVGRTLVTQGGKQLVSRTVWPLAPERVQQSVCQAATKR